MTTLRFCRAALSADFVHQVGQVRARQAGGAARQHRQIHVVAQRNLLGMHAQDGLAPLHVGTAHHHAAVETAGPQQRRVQHVRTIGGRHQDDAFVGFEAVHLDQQLVEGLLALVVSAAQAGAAMPAHGVDFIDEDDAGGVLLALLEEVAHAAGAHAHEHLDEVRSGDGEEGYAGFPGDGSGQQGFAGAGRADQQHALGNAAAELLEFLRLAQKFDDLLQFLFGLFHAGHVFEGDLLLLRGVQARAALAEAQGLVAARLHLPHHEQPEGSEQQEWREIHQHRDPVAGAGVLNDGIDFVVAKLVIEVGVVQRDESMQPVLRVLIDAVNLVPRDADLLDLPGTDFIQEIGEADIFFLGSLWAAHYGDQKHANADQKHPKR